jgi:Cdc6-like AAA superfamily ATPase
MKNKDNTKDMFKEFMVILLPGNVLRGIAMLGDDDVGKTALAQQFIEMTPGGKVILVSAIGCKDMKSLYNVILSTLDLDFTFESLEELEEKVLEILDDLDIKMMFIDDVDELLNEDNDDTRLNLDWLIDLMDASHIPLILIGTLDMENIVEERADRFSITRMYPFGNNDEFRGFLRGYERFLPLRKPSHLDQPPMSDKIHELSGGYIGKIVDILKKAAIAAIEDGIEKITIGHVERNAGLK